MIGEASTTSPPWPSATSTGYRPSPAQAATAAAQAVGGSVAETNVASSAASSRWRPTSACRTASARANVAGWASTSLATVTAIRNNPVLSSTGEMAMSARASMGSRRRVVRRSPSTSTSSPPSTRNVNDRVVEPVGDSGTGSRSICCSHASSQESSAAPTPAPVTVTMRCCTCRKRTRTWSTGSAPGATTTSVRTCERSDGSSSAKPAGTTTPNCQRTRFFVADAR